MLQTVFLKLVNMSITASWLVLALLVFRAVARTTPKWICCAMWSLVGLRLAIPYAVRTGFSLIRDPEPVSLGNQTGTPQLQPWGPGDAPQGMLPVPAVQVRQDTAAVFAYVWLVGVAVMLLYAAVSYMQLRRRVAASLKTEEGIWICDGLSSPFILGILHPRVYLPAVLDGTDRNSVLAHERAHLKRKDHWWKPLGFLFLCVYWFNPFIWLAYACLCRDIEYACDEQVVQEMEPEQRAAYADALLKCGTGQLRTSVVPLAFGETDVRGRIRAALFYRRPVFWVVLLSGILCAAIGLTLATDASMSPCSVMIDGQNYEFLSDRGVNASFDRVIYYDGGEPVGQLTLTVLKRRDCILDLGGLSSCEAVQVIRIECPGRLAELILPEKEAVFCIISAKEIGSISGNGGGQTDLILTCSPEALHIDGGVNDLTVDAPTDLSFLKEGAYRYVTILSGNGKVPEAGCDIQSLSVSGDVVWDLSPLEGDTGLRYLSVSGRSADLSPLAGTGISQICLRGRFDLNGLRGMRSLDTLDLIFGEGTEYDLSEVPAMREDGLKYLNLAVPEETESTIVRNADQVREFCIEESSAAQYEEILTEFVQRGGEITVIPSYSVAADRFPSLTYVMPRPIVAGGA